MTSYVITTQKLDTEETFSFKNHYAYRLQLDIDIDEDKQLYFYSGDIGPVDVDHQVITDEKIVRKIEELKDPDNAFYYRKIKKNPDGGPLYAFGLNDLFTANLDSLNLFDLKYIGGTERPYYIMGGKRYIKPHVYIRVLLAELDSSVDAYALAVEYALRIYNQHEVIPTLKFPHHGYLKHEFFDEVARVLKSRNLILSVPQRKRLAASRRIDNNIYTKLVKRYTQSQI